MTWGVGPWGAGGPWGTGVALPPPVLIGVSDPIVNRVGGTVVVVYGENFYDPMLVEILKSGNVVGEGILWDPTLNLEENRAWVGMPALDDGFYDLRVTTDGGVSPVLVNALEYRLFAEEAKTLAARSKWGKNWDVGPRIMSG